MREGRWEGGRRVERKDRDRGKGGGEKGKLGGGGGGRECLCVCVRVRTFMPTIKSGFYFIKIGNVFSPKRYDKLEKQGTNWERYLQIHI